jgi:hypothetical protein
MVVALLVTFAAPLAVANAAPRAAQAKWTVMVYMAGDNNLQDATVRHQITPSPMQATVIA